MDVEDSALKRTLRIHPRPRHLQTEEKPENKWFPADIGDL